MDELDSYLQRENQKSVLLFPPLPSRLRYLIHSTTENHPPLVTFSVGEGWGRRVVVCYSHLRLDLGDDSDKDRNASFYEETCRGGRVLLGSRRHPPAPPSRGNPKRPDQAIYVPRAARDKQRNRGGSFQPRVDPDEQSPTLSSAASQSCSPKPRFSAEETPSDSLSETIPVADTSRDLVPTSTSNTALEEDLTLRSEKGHWPPTWDQVSYFMAMSLEDRTVEPQEEGRPPEDSVGSSNVAPHQPPPPHTDAAGDLAYIRQQITAQLSEMDVTIEHVHNDYSCFVDAWIDHDEFAHVIEIYDFPAMFKTDDLLDAFSDYSAGGIKIKWVDDTHALGVFSSQSAAIDALSIQHPLLKTRALSKGSKKAKGKAIRRAEFIQPVKERPQTDSVVARRMVARALGMQKARPQHF
ncbi:R3H and coiled-coil domain-containing protein 1 isoform X2 [Esox lucius]|uniref:R3H domain and coiled-coil containing 1 n=2 Tax=Esox lucius TaxID=8010 RepID=A0AAY5L116_ESOLU|nr:R3H and coiled-coil domain-containing protein 1 isoform X2 [Esox lucius]XP_010879650.1 R3H and coiled-coil domain-containing protein 1 isoform X2 [Esox lucius]